MAWNPNPPITIRYCSAAASYKPLGRTVKLRPPAPGTRSSAWDETRCVKSIGLDNRDTEFLESGPGTGTRH